MINGMRVGRGGPRVDVPGQDTLQLHASVMDQGHSDIKPALPHLSGMERTNLMSDFCGLLI